jgi:hypothetical protein
VRAGRDQRFESDLRIKLDQGDAVMRNVSASGLYFVTELKLVPGEALQFTLEFPSPEIGAVKAQCMARVVRVEPQGTLNGVGAAFESIEFRRIGQPTG